MKALLAVLLSLTLAGCALCRESPVACAVAVGMAGGAAVMLSHKQGGNDYCQKNPTADQCR